MLQQNVDIALSQIAPDDIVLDIGGWAQPFNRANYVVDIMPYETRGIFGRIGPKEEHFTSDTWIFHDLSWGRPLPFQDKQIDYAICSHTLEDIRDPLYVCAELQRVAKRGYIEVPSREVESIQGFEARGYAGYYHHRWIVEVDNHELVFRHKPHLLHGCWKYHLPKRYLKRLREGDKVSFLFWTQAFAYRETVQISRLQVVRELESYVRQRRAYPDFYYLLDHVSRPRPFIKKLITMFPRFRRLVEQVRGRQFILVSEWDEFWSKTPEIQIR